MMPGCLVTCFLLGVLLVNQCTAIVVLYPFSFGSPDYDLHNLHALGVNIETETSIVFQARGAPAYILLQNDRADFNNDVIEIVIGQLVGFGTVNSYIRIGQGGSVQDTHNEPGIISNGFSFRTFWVSWDGGCVRVGKGATVGVDEFLQWCGLTFDIAGLSAGSGFGGTFIFPVNGGWSTWGSWGACTQTCGGGTWDRSRTCTNPFQSHGGDDCPNNPADATDTAACNEDECPIDGGWTTWGSWGACTQTCGGGTLGRSRTCTNPTPDHGGDDCPNNPTDTAACNEDECPIDGGWTTWGSWGACTQTCGGGTWDRSRTCTNPTPDHGGADCPSNPADTAPCNEQECPIDGGWTTWGSWGACTQTCGGGTLGRSRTCTNPTPDHGGDDCPNNPTDTAACNENECPIDGGWTTWGSWGACTQTCGGGTWDRSRTCTNPTPDHGGADCPSNPADTAPCNEQECPIDGGWTTWGSWGACTQTCGDGTLGRSRTCTNPTPDHGGDDCPSNPADTLACNEQECPIDGGWTTWGSWGACTQTCGGGTWDRSRTCTNPTPDHGGADCPSNPADTAPCNEQECPIDGGWTTWGSWGTCTQTCGGGTLGRSRTCTNPTPDHGGDDCPNNPTDTAACNEQECPIDGGWTTWGSWGACTQTCGGGTWDRSRTCTNPTPDHGGDDCPNDSADTAPCNEQECPIDGGWTTWGSWGACTQTCGGGTWDRSRTCTNPTPNHGGDDCPNNSADATDTAACNEFDCDNVDGGWSSWESWSTCDVTCGGGTRTRCRHCDNPAPAGVDADCPEPSTDTVPCNTDPCPIDGNWSPWSEWSACGATCFKTFRTRQRTCTDPGPQNGGADCRGNHHMTRRCPLNFKPLGKMK